MFNAFTFSTIKGKQEDALKIIGKSAYNELENTIFQLLDQQNFKTAASHKFSNRVHNDTVQKTASVKLHELERSLVPPYRAKTYREVLGRSPGGYHTKCGSDDEDEEVEQKKGAADSMPDYEREFQRKMEKMNTEWLYRESEYRTPAQKMGMEREWMERRRLLVEKNERRRRERAAVDEKEKIKMKIKKGKLKRKEKNGEKKAAAASDEDTKKTEENGKDVQGEGGEGEGEECVEGRDDVTTVVENGEGGAKETPAVEKGAEKGTGESKETGKNPDQESKGNSAKKTSKKKSSGTAEAMKDLFLAMETLDVGYEQGTMKEEELEALEQAEDDDEDDQ